MTRRAAPAAWIGGGDIYNGQSESEDAMLDSGIGGTPVVSLSGGGGPTRAYWQKNFSKFSAADKCLISLT